MEELQISDLEIGLLGATQFTGSCPLQSILIYLYREELRASSNILSGSLNFSLAFLTYSRRKIERQIKSKRTRASTLGTIK